jgi:hypothetical protein
MLTDCHVHIYDTRTAEQAVRYAHEDGVGRLFALCRDFAALAPLWADETLQTIPFLRLDDPRQPHWDERARGIKLHPRHHIRDIGFEIGLAAMAPTLALAADKRVPIIIHTDTDRPLTATPGALAEVARATPQVKFLAAHLGCALDAYFEPSRGQEYATAAELEAALRRGIAESLRAMIELPNFYVDTTIFGAVAPAKRLLSRSRAELIAEAVVGLSSAQRQRVLDRVIIGTAFPCFVPGARGWDYPYAAGQIYAYQLTQLKIIFGADFSEARVEENVQRLLTA